MKKLLYIAPMSKNRDTMHGYNNVSDSIYDVLVKMKEENLLDFDAFNADEAFNVKDNYEFCFLIINPNVICDNKNVMDFYRAVSAKCQHMLLNILWEADPLPKKWDELLTSNIFDGFLSPCEFITDLLQGIEKPKYPFPYLVDGDIYTSLDIDKKKNEKMFTVLTSGQLTERKSFKESIIAFTKALGDKDDCRLIIKSNRLGRMEEDIDDVIQRQSYLNGLTNAQIFSIKDKSLTQKEIVDLYHSSSIVLLPSRGEGMGLPLLEAMSCGLPAIYVNGTSWRDKKYLTDSNYAISHIRGLQTGMSCYSYDNKSYWCIPTLSSMIYKLESAYDRWKEDKTKYYQMSSFNRDVIHNNFSYGAIKNYILSIFSGEERNFD